MTFYWNACECDDYKVAVLFFLSWILILMWINLKQQLNRVNSNAFLLHAHWMHEMSQFVCECGLSKIGFHYYYCSRKPHWNCCFIADAARFSLIEPLSIVQEKNGWVTRLLDDCAQTIASTMFISQLKWNAIDFTYLIFGQLVNGVFNVHTLGFGGKWIPKSSRFD